MTAGAAMREAWGKPGVSPDDQMNIPTSIIDLDGLRRYETAYTAAVGAHLKKLRRWYW